MRGPGEREGSDDWQVVFNSAVGIVVAPRGRLQFANTLTIEREKIAAYELIADPTRLQQLDFAVLDE